MAEKSFPIKGVPRMTDIKSIPWKLAIVAHLTVVQLADKAGEKPQTLEHIAAQGGWTLPELACLLSGHTFDTCTEHSACLTRAMALRDFYEMMSYRADHMFQHAVRHDVQICNIQTAWNNMADLLATLQHSVGLAAIERYVNPMLQAIVEIPDTPGHCVTCIFCGTTLRINNPFASPEAHTTNAERCAVMAEHMVQCTAHPAYKLGRLANRHVERSVKLWQVAWDMATATGDVEKKRTTAQALHAADAATGELLEHMRRLLAISREVFEAGFRNTEVPSATLAQGMAMVKQSEALLQGGESAPTETAVVVAEKPEVKATTAV